MSDLKLVPNNLQRSESLFKTEKERLEKVLKNFLINIEHIGSTAIPETIGKGIIDILLICQSEDDQGKIKDSLVSNGYIQGELNKEPDGRLFFTNSRGQTQAEDIHLHLVIKNSTNLVSLQFRDYMLHHPDEVKRYNNEKEQLSLKTGKNRHEYAVQKERFILEVMKKIEEKHKKLWDL